MKCESASLWLENCPKMFLITFALKLNLEFLFSAIARVTLQPEEGAVCLDIAKLFAVAPAVHKKLIILSMVNEIQWQFYPNSVLKTPMTLTGVQPFSRLP